jgi:hypothetical protein
MQFARSPGAKPTQAWWHEGRQDARERAFSGDLTAQFSDTEIIKFDLETAQITGAENPRLWKMMPVYDILGISGTDVRPLRDR